ncbi:MAG: hypothetical protein NTY41_17435 [Proteobacteria bacterium]|nr:hypothetical protein [Pseudomonadota bacterium]
MRNRSRFQVWVLALALAALLSAPVLGAGHNLTMDPVAAGPYPVACSNLAHDSAKLSQLGGSLDDYWTGNNGHYIGDILLEPDTALKISPRIPDEGLYPGRRNTLVDFVILVCYPTDGSNFRPDYVLPDGQVLPRMQRAGQSPILPSQPCIAIYPPPAGCGRWPLLAFAHGLDSTPLDSYSIDFLTRFASQGYIVAAAFHGDGRFLRLQLGDVGDLLYLLRHFDAFVELQALRPLAVKSMLDAMLAHPDFGNSIDSERIGGIGVSLGGETMTLLLGAQLTDDYLRETSVKTVTDPRIKAAVGYIPYAGQKYLPAFGKDNATAANVNVPYLAISGIDDDVAPMYRMEEALNNFRSARYQVGLAGVAHEYAATYADDIVGWAIPFLTSYLDCSELGRASRERLLQQHSIRGGLDDQLLVSRDAPALCFAQGWNLLGNGSDASLDVAATFADSTRFQTVWKWLPAQNGWAFFSPSLAAQGGTTLADYAAAKGYRLLTTISGGEGFWVHANLAGSVNLPAGNAVPVAALGASLVKGWNLVSVGETTTPQQFCGAPGNDVTTLWTWEAASSGWYFYAPGLAAKGELANYIISRGYLENHGRDPGNRQHR